MRSGREWRLDEDFDWRVNLGWTVEGHFEFKDTSAHPGDVFSAKVSLSSLGAIPEYVF